MRLIGIGTDLVAVARFRRLIDRSGRRFLERWFTAAEVEYCLVREHPAQHVAARFAAKESVLKSLRVPAHGPVRWREIEVIRDADGLPGIQLHGATRELAASVGLKELHVSLSHDADYATATVAAIGEPYSAPL